MKKNKTNELNIPIAFSSYMYVCCHYVLYLVEASYFGLIILEWEV